MPATKSAPKKKAPVKKSVKKTAVKAAASKARSKSTPKASKSVAAKTSKVSPVKTKASRPAAVRASPNNDLTTFKNFTPYTEKKGEEYMNKAQVEHFRNILRAWKHELMEEVDRTMHYMQDEAANFPDPNDRATQESDFTMELRTRDRERKLIKKIDEALINLDNDEYGYCEVCGVEIGLRRMEARPTATLCIDCKTLEEIRERQNT